MPNASVCALITAEAGRMWSSTGDGVVVIDPDSFAIQSLQQAEGVSVRSFWAHSGTRTQAGEFVFGGVGGAAVLRPDRIVPRSFGAKMAVTGLRIGGQPVSVEDQRPSPRRSSDHRTGRQQPRRRILPARLRRPRTHPLFLLDGEFRSRLEPDRFRAPDHPLHQSSAGEKYVLHLKGEAGPSQREPGELSLPIEVRPGWRQSPWLRLALVAIAGAGCWLIVRLRTTSLHRQRRALEAKVEVRTRELAEAAETLRQANAELDRLANVDGLTGLANRRHFVQIAEGALTLAARHDHPLSVFLVDLDHFKKVNDTYGHGAGDAVLKAAADCLAGTLRDSDLAARFGGGELIVLLPHTDEKGAAHLAERFLATLAALEIRHEDRPIAITASAGVASRRFLAESLNTIIERADKALYRAKRGGRNRVETLTGDTTGY